MTHTITMPEDNESSTTVPSNTYFIQRGEAYFVTPKASLLITDKLPPAVYSIGITREGEFFFSKIDDFNMPKKMYGDTTAKAARILNTFNMRTASTGVLLSGEKGSGKSLLAKQIAIDNLAQGNPVIVVNAAWKGESFNKLIQSLGQSATILFDEFEKVYDKDDQEAILTLLDGVYSTKKLFVFTVNDVYHVDHHMRNRPGRIFYNIEYSGLTTAFIREYCIDCLDDKQYVESVCQVAALFEKFNFDMLQSLIEEMNRYQESPQDALTMLNAKPRGENDTRYDIRLFIGDQEIEQSEIRPNNWCGSPVHSPRITISREWYHVNKKASTTLGQATGADVDDDDEGEWKSASYIFSTVHCVQIDPDTNTITYVNRDGAVPMSAVFKKRAIERFNFSQVSAF